MGRRIDISPAYEHLRAFVESIPETMEAQGTYIYGGRRNLIVKMTAQDGQELNVKRFHQPRGLNRLVYSCGIRQPKGRRAFTYPARLLAKGIETPEAVAYIEDRNAMGLLCQSWLISKQCPYSHLLYEMGDASPDVYEPMAQALACFAAHMHQQEVLHLDFSPGNILWEKKRQQGQLRQQGESKPLDLTLARQEYQFSIVDVNRMRFGPVSMEDGCKSFARLWGPKRFIRLLVEEYARQRGFDPEACVDITMQERARFWTHYQKKREMEFNLEL